MTVLEVPPPRSSLASADGRRNSEGRSSRRVSFSAEPTGVDEWLDGVRRGLKHAEALFQLATAQLSKSGCSLKSGGN